LNPPKTPPGYASVPERGSCFYYTVLEPRTVIGVLDGTCGNVVRHYIVGRPRTDVNARKQLE
jgi:hypothetical protein